MVKMPKGPFMEYLRAKVFQAVANTLEEIQIPTPTSRTEHIAMLIHSVEFHPLTLHAVAPANTDYVMTQLTKISTTVSRHISDVDMIAKYKALTVLDAVFGQIVEIGTQKQTFDPPILYPHANLYFSTNTLGHAVAKSADIRIGYTLEKVSREDFISALVE